MIDDRSTDSTHRILKSLTRQYPELKVHRTSRNFGVAPCIYAGLENAKGTCAIYIDADLQDPPELIAQMVSKYKEGFDVVHMIRKKREGDGLAQKALTFLAYRILQTLSDVPIYPDCGDFKLYSRRVINQLVKIGDYDPFIRGLSFEVGFDQTFLEYDRQPRVEGRSKFNVLTSAAPAREFFRALTSLTSVPILISGFLFLAHLIFALGVITISIHDKLMGLAAPGQTGILLFLSVSSIGIYFCLFIFGIFITKILKQSRGFPRYLFDKKEK